MMSAHRCGRAVVFRGADSASASERTVARGVSTEASTAAGFARSGPVTAGVRITVRDAVASAMGFAVAGVKVTGVEATGPAITGAAVAGAVFTGVAGTGSAARGAAAGLAALTATSAAGATGVCGVGAGADAGAGAGELATAVVGALGSGWRESSLCIFQNVVPPIRNKHAIAAI